MGSYPTKDDELTAATVSPSAAALRFSRAFAFAVVERTAVATLATASFFGGLVGEGYANRLGFELERNSNLGAYMSPIVSIAGSRYSGIGTDLQVLVKTNDTSRLEGQARAVRQRVPIPELAEQNHTHNSAGVAAARPALQADGDIAATSIDETLTKGGTKACHGVIVLVSDDLGVKRTGGCKGRR